MPTTVASLLADLRRHQLLTPAQLDPLAARRFADAKALAQDLVQRGWLTAYQARHLLSGKAAELVRGHYVILDRLGEGGMGQVFKARNRRLNRLVALKVIAKELVGDTEIIGRFYREMQVTSNLSHPNVIRADDAGPVGDTHFMAMEYVEGIDLHELVGKQGPLSVPQACEYIRQAALGLQAIHEHGLVHRDIKPSNLLVSGGVVSGGVVSGEWSKGTTHPSPLTPHQIKILDLGLARLHESIHGKTTTRLPDGQSLTTLTLDGPTTLGSVDYLSPEQALDFHRVDIRADIYSLGCTFFFLLTGNPPFGSGPLAVKLMRHQQAEPPELARFRGDVPPGLVPVLARMLAKKPENRYQTPGEVAAALAAFASHSGDGPSAPATQPATSRTWLEGVRASRQPLGILAAILISIIGLVFVLRWSMSSSPATDTGAASIRPMRNLQMREVSGNHWVRIGPFQGKDRDSREVSLFYDPDRGRFIRIGGRTSAYSNEISSFDLGTERWSLILPYATDPAAGNRGLANRPGYGSYRGSCYDRDNHCVWDHCQNQHDGGVNGLWQGKGELRPEQWVHIKEVPARSSPRVAYDEHARKLVCVGTDMGSWGKTNLYDPATREVTEANADPSGAKSGRTGMGPFFGFLYVPELKGCLLVGRNPDKFRKEGGPEMATWLFDATTGKWTDLAPRGAVPSLREGMGVSYDRKNRIVLLFGGVNFGSPREVLDDFWAYDPVRNTWTEIRSENSPREYYKNRPIGPGDCQMFAYDEEHNVHILVLQDWAKESFVWAYRYKR